jgi:hypothetical protein
MSFFAILVSIRLKVFSKGIYYELNIQKYNLQSLRIHNLEVFSFKIHQIFELDIRIQH